MASNLPEVKENNFEKLSWDILDKLFLKPKTLVQHQIESYNDCIENQIPKIIKQYIPIINKLINKYVKHIKHCLYNAEHGISKICGEIYNMEGMTGKKTRHFYNNLLAIDDARYGFA